MQKPIRWNMVMFARLSTLPDVLELTLRPNEVVEGSSPLGRDAV